MPNAITQRTKKRDIDEIFSASTAFFACILLFSMLDFDDVASVVVLVDETDVVVAN